MRKYDAVIIGGGSAGLAAAISLDSQGISDILLLERDQELGGILNQCIHNGFGVQIFKEELTGPEYAQRYKEMFLKRKIPYKIKTMVLNINNDKTIEYANAEEGFVKITAKAIILTTGCYERNAGAIQLQGERPSGVITAGTAQKYLNLDGYLVGKKVFILGSGDIGLIMARRMTLEGATVLGVAEIMPYSSGLKRNIVQCLEDFDIPLFLNHTVTKIIGKNHLQQIVIQEVQDFQPIDGTEKIFDVDTLLLSIGLIPESTLAEQCGALLHKKTKGLVVDESYQTTVDGLFACGNALHVHDLVDYVSKESAMAGRFAASYIKNETKTASLQINIVPVEGVATVVPQTIHPKRVGETLDFFLRVEVVCASAEVIIKSDNQELLRIKKTHLAPAEMLHISLPNAILLNLDKDLTIGLEVIQ